MTSRSNSSREISPFRSTQSLTLRTSRCSAAVASTAPSIALPARTCWKHVGKSTAARQARHASPGFRLPAQWVIHTVGPIWRGGQSGEDDSSHPAIARASPGLIRRRHRSLSPLSRPAPMASHGARGARRRCRDRQLPRLPPEIDRVLHRSSRRRGVCGSTATRLGGAPAATNARKAQPGVSSPRHVEFPLTRASLEGG